MAALCGMNPRQLAKFETQRCCADDSTLQKLVHGFNRHSNFVVRMKTPSLDLLDPVSAAFRHFVLTLNTDCLPFLKSQELHAALSESTEPIYMALSRFDLPVLLTHLVCRGYAYLDASGKYYLLQQKPQQEYEQLIHFRIGTERVCVAWNFDPARRENEQPVILENMRAQLARLRAFLAEMSLPGIDRDTFVALMHTFYMLEPEVHVEKAGRHGVMRDELALKLGAVARIAHDYLELRIEHSQKKWKVVARSLVDEARTMLGDHETFIDRAAAGAELRELCDLDFGHGATMIERIDAYFDLLVRHGNA
ncbi:hypothetical protein [Botrimarina colliarenosi]|nr:hypothetical protein [Botrimarina colliarenosi]